MKMIQVNSFLIELVEARNGVVPEPIWSEAVKGDYAKCREDFIAVSGEFGIEPGLGECREILQKANGLITEFLQDKNAGRWNGGVDDQLREYVQRARQCVTDFSNASDVAISVFERQNQNRAPR